jgi:hypothetical protein
MRANTHASTACSVRGRCSAAGRYFRTSRGLFASERHRNERSIKTNWRPSVQAVDGGGKIISRCSTLPQHLRGMCWMRRTSARQPPQGQWYAHQAGQAAHSGRNDFARSIHIWRCRVQECSSASMDPFSDKKVKPIVTGQRLASTSLIMSLIRVGA